MKLLNWIKIGGCFVFVCYSLLAQAKVEVSWGNGSLKIEDSSEDELEGKAQALRVLETELLIDDRLSATILSSSKKSLVLPEQVLNLEGEALKEAIIAAIKKSHKSAGASSEKSKKSPPPSGSQALPPSSSSSSSSWTVLNHSNTVFVSGDDEITVEEDEVIDYLIVLGGKVEIFGEVKRLVLIKGNVEVRAGGRVSHQVQELVGSLNVDEQGFVTPNKSGILDHFEISGSFLKGLSDFKGWKLQISSVLFRWVQTLFLFWLGFRLVPYVNENLFRDSVSWGASFFVGLIHFSVIPFALFIMAVSILGLSLIPVYLGLVYVLGLVGYGLISARLGYCLLSRFGPEAREKSKYLYFFVGFCLCEILMSAPTLGYVFLVILMVLSLGLSTQLVFKAKPSRKD